MTTPGAPRTARGRMVVAVAGTLVLGLVGAALVAEWLLLAMPLPRSSSGRAWRTFGLTALSTGVLAGLVGGTIGLIVGYPLLYDGLLAALTGLAGLALGSMAGAVVSLDAYRREVRPT